jgi:hypothetical protein
VDYFLEEIQASLDAGIYSPSLLSALVVPDKFGSDIGISSDILWRKRNCMIHETSLKFSHPLFDRVAFTTPESQVHLHRIIFCIGENRVFLIDLERFVSDTIKCAMECFESLSREEKKEVNNLIQIRRGGLYPFILGTPVIS